MERVLRGLQHSFESEALQHNNPIEGFTFGFFTVVMAVAAVGVYYKKEFINLKEQFKNYEENDLV
jgi:hypothetical protein